MARHDNRNAVAAVGVSHGARSGRLAGPIGELSISDRRAEGDLHKLPPDTLLKRRSREPKRHVELLPLAGKVFGELLTYRCEWRVRLFPRGARPMPALV